MQCRAATAVCIAVFALSPTGVASGSGDSLEACSDPNDSGALWLCERSKLAQYDKLIASVLEDLDRLSQQLGRPIPIGESQSDWQRFRLKRCGEVDPLGDSNPERALKPVVCQRELSHERWLHLESVLSDYDRDAQSKR